MGEVSAYHQFVANLAKPAQDIAQEIRPHQLDILHGAIGVAGEAGELLDAVKKSAIYQKPLDVGNVIEELGDLEFYMQHIRNCIGVTRDTILQANMVKLKARYAAGSYSNEQAQNRADKLAGE